MPNGQLATYVTGSTEEQRAYLRWRWIHTQVVVQTERAPITALATTMLGGRLTLGYCTALAIIRQARREPCHYAGSTEGGGLRHGQIPHQHEQP